MKKFIALFLVPMLATQSAFADIPKTTEVSLSDILSLENIFSPTLSISEWRTMMDFFLDQKSFQTYTFFSPTPASEEQLSREMAVFLVLKKMGISLDFTETSKYFHNTFEDVHENSFFAPYILFAREAGIIDENSNHIFGGKEIISRAEFKKLVTRAFDEQYDFTRNLYESEFFNEENVSLYSANESDYLELQDILDQVRTTITYNGELLYQADTSAIYPFKGENGEVFFPKIPNINEYYLYFDYNGIPFLMQQKIETVTQNDIAKDFIPTINQYRIQMGFEPLKENAILNKTAQEYAKKLFQSQLFQHEDSQWERVGERLLKNDYFYHVALENLGRGQNSVDEILNDWKVSIQHHRNLLNERINEIGIGFYGGYWVQIGAKEFTFGNLNIE